MISDGHGWNREVNDTDICAKWRPKILWKKWLHHDKYINIAKLERHATVQHYLLQTSGVGVRLKVGDKY